MLDRKLLDIKTTRHVGPKVLCISIRHLFGRGCSVGNARVGLDKHSISNLLRTNTAYFIVGIMSFYGQGSV